MAAFVEVAPPGEQPLTIAMPKGRLTDEALDGLAKVVPPPPPPPETIARSITMKYRKLIPAYGTMNMPANVRPSVRPSA